MTLARHLVAVIIIVAASVLWAAPEAEARGYQLPEARIHVEVLSDGSLEITEDISFAFTGRFEGAYRDIPSRFGERVPLDSIRVGEGEVSYEPGGTTTLGEPGPPNTFAVGPHEGGVRVVWRYTALDEIRTFRIAYRMVDVVRVYDDTAELDLRVWGDHWPERLERLEASVRLPRSVQSAQEDRLRVWGQPAGLRGVVDRDPQGGRLEVSGIASEQWVEIRMLFPPDVLDSTGGAQRDGGQAFDRIVGEQMQVAQAAARDEERLQWVQRNAWWLVILGLILLVGPALVAFVVLALRFGRDPKLPGPPVDYVREPPADDSPALVGGLMRENQTVGVPEFIATFFDLVRRGYFEVAHESREESTWMGLRKETVSDLRVTLTDKDAGDLERWDRDVYDSIEWIIPPSGELMSRFGDVLQERARDFHQRFTSFQNDVRKEVRARKWMDKRGKTLWTGTVTGFGAVAVAGFAIGMWEVSRDNLPVFGWPMALLGLTNALVLGGLGALRPTWLTRRTKEGARLAAAWDGMRRFLNDFSAMRDAPPISVVLWEQLLVYGIVLGVADRVLEAAQLVAPHALEEQSRIFWVDGTGTPLGGGLTWLRLDTLSLGVNRAVAAGVPRSAVSGFGGGFSGGGGSGGGGGGGGAW